MADNVPITAGSGTTVGTDERTIATVSVHVQRVIDQGATAIAANDVSVTTTAAQKVAARETRKRVVLYSDPTNAADMYIGASGVDAATPANGAKLVPGAALTLYTTAAIYADAVSGTLVLYYVEEYDA